jgi:hypothetical protein
MAFAARFPSWCRVCNREIRIGDQIVAELGGRPTHARCDDSAPTRSAPVPGRQLATGKQVDCGDCYGAGWKHVQEKQHVIRCERCARFGTDKDAALAHRTDCGCEWEARQGGNRATRNKAGQVVLDKGVPIYSKFDGKCKGCGQEYGAGSSVIWYGKGGGCYHVFCDPNRDRPAPTRQTDEAEADD